MAHYKCMTKAQTIRTAKTVGPRVVGGRYLSGYWGTEYTVLAIDVDTSGWMRSITVCDDQSTRTHSTAWDKRDRVLFTPST